MNIQLAGMENWTPGKNREEEMKISAFQNGYISLNETMKRRIAEKLEDSWNMDIYATKDQKILALHPSKQSDFRFPKNGRRNFK